MYIYSWLSLWANNLQLLKKIKFLLGGYYCNANVYEGCNLQTEGNNRYTCRCRRIVSHSAAVVRQETSPLREAHPGRWLMTHNSTADLPAVSSCQIPPLGLDSELDYSGWSPRI